MESRLHDRYDSEIKEVFDLTIKQCKRSSTIERSIHSDLVKDNLLVKALQDNADIYGINISAQFQKIHEKNNPALSFLFAQVTNLILERTFHIGSCVMQADVALLEFCKKGVFNASLICSNPSNPKTQHFYLTVLDDQTFMEFSKWPDVYCIADAAIEPNLFSESVYFDTWSKQLCEWKRFTPDAKNVYLKDLKKLKQAMFKPLVLMFKDEVALLENIIFCLNEYEKYIEKDKNTKKDIPLNYIKLFFNQKNEFQEEVEFLFDYSECKSRLLKAIDVERKEFERRLTSIKQVKNNDCVEKGIEVKLAKLNLVTAGFFSTSPSKKWQQFPQNRIAKNSAYAGHDLWFFTFEKNDIGTKQSANTFAKTLVENGLCAELKKANEKPSIIVDLTRSSLR